MQRIGLGRRPIITGEGTYSFRIASPSSNGADYASREAGNGLVPILVLELTPS